MSFSASKVGHQSDVAQAVGQVEWTTPGTYSWVCPADGSITEVCAVAIGGGGGNSPNSFIGRGGGGLGWKNNIPVTPGQSYSVVVGASPTLGDGGDSYFISAITVCGKGSQSSGGGSWVGDGGGVGGNGGGVGGDDESNCGGGGAGGYSGGGGHGASSHSAATGSSGSGGAGAGGNSSQPGGGVGTKGQGSSGTSPGVPGSGGVGKQYGAGAGTNGTGGSGAVRLIWGPNRAFPSTNTGDM